jgi:hypothetical protein
MKKLSAVKPYAKAVVGCAAAFVGSVVTGYADGHMVAGEWWAAAGAGLGALALVFGVKNADAQPGAVEQPAGDTPMGGDVPSGGFE